ncbi:condensation domain-containing protein [Dactylosporangium sp. NPDC051541]|uniref:condensation domain-containing protein n=1 Tax=Dactylosporangium sp. NPDC051541 TaxID=3363977 RepID=UPI003791B6E9
MTVTRVEVPFAAADSGVAELTWGQRAMLRAMRREDSWLPMGGHRPVAAGTTLADVAGELRYTMERWQAFRTRLRPGRTEQEVFASGVARLDVVDADGSDPNEVAAAVERGYRTSAPDLVADWPMRMAAICERGTPVRLVAVMPHLVTDGLGGAIMVDEATRRVTTPITGLTPLGIAAWQASAAGVRQHAGARRHWDRHAGDLPAFTASVSRPRYRKCVLESPALADRLPKAAARSGTDESTVLLAAYFAALARVTGSATIGVRQVVSNRFRSGLSDVVSPITQLGLCVVDVPPAFADAVPAVAKAALPARKYAYYDPHAIPALATPCFNDRRTVTTTSFGAEPSSSVLTWSEPVGPTEPLFLHADDVPGAVRLILDVDTACFTPAAVEELVRTIESVVA